MKKKHQALQKKPSKLPIPEWQRKAQQLFPFLKLDYTNPSIRVYDVFFELLHRCRKPDFPGKWDQLRDIYAYADWCWRTDIEGTADLGNAVGVAFYEHLVESAATRQQIIEWMAPDIFEALSCDECLYENDRFKSDDFDIEIFKQEYWKSHDGRQHRNT